MSEWRFEGMESSGNNELHCLVDGLITGVTLTRRDNGDVALSIQTGEGVHLRDYVNVIVMQTGEGANSKEKTIKQHVKFEMYSRN
jgi:hypothetical protein